MKDAVLKALAIGLLIAAVLFGAFTAAVFLAGPAGAYEDGCAYASLRHEEESAWDGYTCADIDDLVHNSEQIKSQARNTVEKWGDLVIAFIAVVLAGLAALLAQALRRMGIAFVDSLRPDNDSPFYLSQLRLLYQKEEPTIRDMEKMQALARVISGGAIAWALLTIAFALVYLALLTG